jgi:hypothetical protein
MWTPEQRDALRVLADVYLREDLAERAVVILEALRDDLAGVRPVGTDGADQSGAGQQATRAQVLIALAYAYLSADRFDAALATADAYLALHPAPGDAAGAWLLRSRAAWGLGSSDEAMHGLQRYEALLVEEGS